MIDKRACSAADAVSAIFSGSTIMIGGFGGAGSPVELIHALVDQGADNLTVISNNAGNGRSGLAALIENDQVSKMICSYPRSANSSVFQKKYSRGEIELELAPQGTLAERIRAGGAGIPAFYSAAAVGTTIAQSKETRNFCGREYLLECGLKADFALLKCECADRFGNLTYNKTARNFNPLMAMAADTTIVQTRILVEPGAIDPETVVTPGIFVDSVVTVSEPAHETIADNSGTTTP